jgi:hypothetical protein
MEMFLNLGSFEVEKGWRISEAVFGKAFFVSFLGVLFQLISLSLESRFLCNWPSKADFCFLILISQPSKKSN